VNRRQFITTACATALWAQMAGSGAVARPVGKPVMSLLLADADDLALEPDLAPAQKQSIASVSDFSGHDDAVRDYLYKMRHYDQTFETDIIVDPSKQAMFTSILKRLSRLQLYVGHGTFYILSMDEARAYAHRSPVGSFPRAELLYLESVFNTDAKEYGFQDQKPLSDFTAQIGRKSVIKVPRMGNYVYRGPAEKRWKEIQRLLGRDVVLTSGIRGIVKQFHLFFAKTNNNAFNLSLASRSLAPPGYSFHGIGDFDVGQRGFGLRNFSTEFMESRVYKELSQRGYISLRYPRDNFLGVRFEPWHVKVDMA